MGNKTKPLYEFGPFRISAEDRLLFKENEVVPLAPKVFDILLTMVEKSGRVLDKDELIQQVWADTFVEEGNLARNVSTLRKALGESDEGRPYIETIPRRGYRFIAPVREVYDNTLYVRESSSITIEQEEFVADDRGEAAATLDGQITLAGVQTRTRLLDGASGVSTLPATDKNLQTARRAKLLWAFAALLILLALSAAYFIGRRSKGTSLPGFHRLTFRRGNLSRARIAPDGQTIIYSATLEGKPPELFMTRLGSPDSQPLGIPNADIFSISSSGQMAILLWDTARKPTLAQIPLVGGEPRKLLDRVTQADWSPDGKNLAVVHIVEGQGQVEYPIGNSIYQSPDAIGDIRFSPKGDRIAFSEYHANEPDSVEVIDLTGKKRRLSGGWAHVQGIAWSANGGEVWFSAAQTGFALALYAVDLSGNVRVVARIPGKMSLQDITSDGRVLIEQDVNRVSMIYGSEGGARERDLSWLDGSTARHLSDDGKIIIFNERGEAGGESTMIYSRRTDGSSAVKLGEGRVMAVSPDNQLVLTLEGQTAPQQLTLLPTGAGQTVRLDGGKLQSYTGQAAWFPDGKRILFVGREPEQKPRLYVQAIAGGPPQAILSEGIGYGPLSPDGNFLAARGPDKKLALYPLAGGALHPIPGVEEGEQPLRFSADGQALYLARFRDLPGRIYRLDLTTGRRELWKELAPPDLDWFGAITSGYLTPDGKSYVYSYHSVISTLYLVDDLN